MSLGIAAGTWLAAGAVVGGGLIAANAAGEAADTQAQAAERASTVSERQSQQIREDQLKQYEQQRADLAPYREAGVASLGQLTRGVAPGGEYARSFGLSDFQADPGYQFRVQQGEQGIGRAASARGGQYSGATLKALARFNQDIGSQEYGNAYSRFNADRTAKFNRAASLAGISQAATESTGGAGRSAYGTIAQSGQNTANQIGQNLQNAGEARASGYVGQANAIGSGIKQAYNAYQQNQALQGGGFLNSNQAILNQGVTPTELYGSF